MAMTHDELLAELATMGHLRASEAGAKLGIHYQRVNALRRHHPELPRPMKRLHPTVDEALRVHFPGWTAHNLRDAIRLYLG